MARILALILAGGILFSVTGCSGGGIDSRNKDLDRPKSANERPVEAPKK